MEKPDRKRVSDAVKKMTDADAALYKIINETEQYRNQVQSAYANLQRANVQETLKNISVDELNRDKNGIRIAVLKNAGYQNISQVIKASHQQLVALNGIGEEGATKIKKKAEEICKTAEQLTRVKLTVEDKNQDTMKIVSAIAALMKTKKISDRATELYGQYHDELMKNMASAKQNKSLVKWIFSSKQKKNERVTSLQYLENLVSLGMASEAQTLAKEYMDTVRLWYAKRCWDDFENNAAAYFAWLEQITGAKDVEDVTLNGLSEELAKSIDEYPLDTSLLKVMLRNYQVFGTKYILHQKRVLLGDEMGLGKTVQAIASMAHLKAAGKTHFVVVCPVSVMINWIREISQHSELQAVKVHGDTRDESFAKWQEEGGVIVTTYETISRVELADTAKIDMLIVDEAHYVKNPEAIRTKALMKFAEKSEYILFMTGTPIEN